MTVRKTSAIDSGECKSSPNTNVIDVIEVAMCFWRRDATYSKMFPMSERSPASLLKIFTSMGN
jgi:hypothetical protein